MESGKKPQRLANGCGNSASGSKSPPKIAWIRQKPQLKAAQKPPFCDKQGKISITPQSSSEQTKKLEVKSSFGFCETAITERAVSANAVKRQLKKAAQKQCIGFLEIAPKTFSWLIGSNSKKDMVKSKNAAAAEI